MARRTANGLRVAAARRNAGTAAPAGRGRRGAAGADRFSPGRAERRGRTA